MFSPSESTGIWSLADVRRALASADRGIALLPVQVVEPRIIDRHRESKRRTEARWGNG